MFCRSSTMCDIPPTQFTYNTTIYHTRTNTCQSSTRACTRNAALWALPSAACLQTFAMRSASTAAVLDNPAR